MSLYVLQGQTVKADPTLKTAEITKDLSFPANLGVCIAAVRIKIQRQVLPTLIVSVYEGSERPW